MTLAPVPAIYSPQPTNVRLGPLPRLLALGISAACLAGLVMSAIVEPSATGVGTHTELGFRPCGFLERTGVPCLTCGITTSFAWFARGEFLASAYVQPLGFVAALGTAAVFWIALYIGLSGRPAHRLLGRVPYRYYLIPLFALAVVAWAWKIVIHVQRLDGWP